MTEQGFRDRFCHERVIMPGSIRRFAFYVNRRDGFLSSTADWDRLPATTTTMMMRLLWLMTNALAGIRPARSRRLQPQKGDGARTGAEKIRTQKSRWDSHLDSRDLHNNNIHTGLQNLNILAFWCLGARSLRSQTKVLECHVKV